MTGFVLQLVLDHILEYVIALVAGRLGLGPPPSLPRPRHPLPANARAKMPALATAYLRWAMRSGFVYDDVARGYRGTRSGREILVRPGLEGSGPIGVEVQIAVAHGVAPLLLDAPPGPSARGVVHEVGALFAELPALRTVAFAADVLRLRLAPLTDPELTDEAVTRALEALGAPARVTTYR